MTPEVRELAEAATETVVFAFEHKADYSAMMARYTRLASAVLAVEALEDPAKAHEAALARRIAEDGGRMNAQSMGIEE